MNLLRSSLSIILLVTACTAPAQARADDAQSAALVLRAHGEGVQIYSCVHEMDWKWKLKGPEATLFDAAHRSIGKHFPGPTWRLDDGSEVQGKVLTSTPHAGTIPWLVLEAGSTGGAGVLKPVTRVTRTQTEGGVAPASACDAQHADAEVRVPYSADYSFYSMKP